MDGVPGIVHEKLDVSGDGTCIKTGDSPYSVKICDCKSKGIYNCELKVDIPLSLRLVDAKRNDSITAVVALNEFTEL